MSTRGWLMLAGTMLVCIAIVNVYHEDSMFWAIIGAAAFMLAALAFVTGIFGDDQDDMPPRQRVLSEGDRVIIQQVEDEYLASTNIPEKTPEWESQG